MGNPFAKSKSKTNNMTITAEAFQSRLQRSSEYKIFIAQTDCIAARELVSDFYNTYLSVNGRPIDIDSKRLEGLISALKSFLNRDGVKALTNRANINMVFGHCLNGRMHTSMLKRGNLDWPVPSDVGDVDSEIRRAMNWIIDRSSTAEFAGDRLPDLERAMRDVILHRSNVLSLNTLNALNGSAGKKQAVLRFPHLETFYVGTAAGRHLQRYVANKASEMAQTVAGRNKWYYVATFQLLGNIIAHGFGDGNGRTARALFACTQIQNKLPFIAPCFDWTRHQVVTPNVHFVAHASEGEINQYINETIDKLI